MHQLSTAQQGTKPREDAGSQSSKLSRTIARDSGASGSSGSDVAFLAVEMTARKSRSSTVPNIQIDVETMARSMTTPRVAVRGSCDDNNLENCWRPSDMLA